MATWYLNADSGNDTTGNGTSGSPYLTISKAHTVAASGDTVVLQDSTATYSFVDQTFSKNLTFQGQSDDASGAILDGGNLGVKWQWDGNSALTLAFEKITLRNAKSKSSWGLFSLGDGAAGGTTTLTTTNCIFKTLDTESGPIFGEGSNNGWGLVWTATNCLFDDMFGGGYWMQQNNDGGANVQWNCTWTNCTWSFNRDSDQIGSIFGFQYMDLEVTNQLVFKNCIMANHGTATVNWKTLSNGDQPSQSATYSCFYGITSGITTGTGVITSDPLFVDEDNSNFNLRTTSPCIDTGTLV